MTTRETSVPSKYEAGEMLLTVTFDDAASAPAGNTTCEPSVRITGPPPDPTVPLFDSMTVTLPSASPSSAGLPESFEQPEYNSGNSSNNPSLNILNFPAVIITLHQSAPSLEF
jgi:hypothetical protein